jgi:hypothetical protein
MAPPSQLSSSANVAERHPPAKPRGRLIELDILRGFLLVWMTFTHLPTKANLISNQTFGFVSGAEGFIFLAGFMIGQLEHHIEKKRGARATLRDIGKRTLRVYLYHMALVAIAFTVFASLAVAHHLQAIQNLLSYFLQSPKEAVAAAALLVYRPSLLDILPMYVVFLALTPLARRAAGRWTWDPVIYTSLIVWAAAQFGLRHWLYNHVVLFGLSVPESSTGAFDLYAWQLLWMAGLALGSINAERIAPVQDSSEVQPELALTNTVVRLSMVVSAVFLVLRYSPYEHWFAPEIFNWLTDKWHLGAARVINFTALTIVLVRYGAPIANFLLFRPLALLGQASIEVFSLHLLFCFVGDSLSHSPDPVLPAWQQILLLISTMTGLFSIALASRWAKTRRKRAASVT